LILDPPDWQDLSVEGLEKVATEEFEVRDFRILMEGFSMRLA
jgi:hypothetical protein